MILNSNHLYVFNDSKRFFNYCHTFYQKYSVHFTRWQLSISFKCLKQKLQYSSIIFYFKSNTCSNFCIFTWVCECSYCNSSIFDKFTSSENIILIESLKETGFLYRLKMLQNKLRLFYQRSSEVWDSAWISYWEYIYLSPL